MNYNFTDGVRRLFQRARQDAFERGHDCVATEHLLRAALGDRQVETLLRQMRLDARAVEAGLNKHLGESPGRPAGDGAPRIQDTARKLSGLGRRRNEGGEIPYASRAKKTIEYALAEAREAKNDYVDSTHLLLGLVRDGEGVAATVLAKLDVTLERARAARAGEELPSTSRLTVQIDDSSDRSIYEQIVAQVTEAIATGTLRPGERLPTVRQLADELDIAPGTVARAYGELEREKLVVTEGVRGTRVASRAETPIAASDRPETLTGLLRPVVVAAFHLGGSAAELRMALDEAMRGIFDRNEEAA
jgi:GntR family transcriptional regulator